MRDVQIARPVTIIQQLWKMTVDVSIVVAVIVRKVVLDAFGVCGGGCLCLWGQKIYLYSLLTLICRVMICRGNPSIHF